MENGGETEFTNGMKIKAEKGKLVMFPALLGPILIEDVCHTLAISTFLLGGCTMDGINRDTRFIAACEKNRKRQLVWVDARLAIW